MRTRQILISAMVVLFATLALMSCGGGGGGGGGGDGDPGDPGGSGGGGGGTVPPESVTIWTTQKAGHRYPINAVARSSSGFVAVTDDGKATTSADGYKWGVPVSTNLFTFKDVVWGNDQFAAVGSFGYIATSPDGVTWTKRSECGGLCTEKLLSIVWSGSRYVACR